MSWYRYGDFAPYVSVATKIARGHAAARKLAKKEGRSPDPVKVDGRKIAKTFWGMKWCENLECYRDYANRLPRGATYVRNGSVADLMIEPGCVRAIVGGSSAYTVRITIKTLPPAVWKKIGRDCASEIESLFDLLQGRFSEGVMTRLTRAEDGLFPRPNEISLSCTCPDSAGVCKHIAATMYGVGSRLDARPELLFTLRNVDHHELIGHATSNTNLNQSLGTTDGMALSDGELLDIFGIEMESSTKDDSTGDSTGKKPSRTKTTKKKPATKGRKTQITASPLTRTTTKAVGTPAVTKRRGKTEFVVAEVKKAAARKSTASTKGVVEPKVNPESSVRAAKAKAPKTPSPARTRTRVPSKPTAARTKASPEQSPAAQPKRPRRAK